MIGLATPLHRTSTNPKTIRSREWKNKNPDFVREQNKRRHERLKKEIFTAYGNQCRCCGETDLHFLTIEHKDKVIPESHRQPDGRRLSGTAILYQLRREGYPDTCEILCWNCNCSYGYYGFCPHQPHTPEMRRYS